MRDILNQYIPEDIFNLPKKGFSIPLAKWIRQDLREDILDKLKDDFLHSIPNFNIDKFKLELENHMKGTEDNSFNIWKVYILRKWLDNYGLLLRRQQ